jgi:hypothetical protein
MLVRGIGAGIVGTACMTALQEYMAARRRRAAVATTGGDVKSDNGGDPWAKAPAPAQLARRVVLATVHRDVPSRYIPLFTNAVHWGYGTSLGALYGAAQEAARGKPAVRGPLFGLGVWAWSYATLVPLGLYEWPWHYKAKTVAKDVSYHLVYGAGVAAGYRILERKR